MRILLAVHQFLPEFRAGTETLTLRTGQELQRRGHSVWVLTGSEALAEAPVLQEEEQAGLRVIRLRAPAPPSPLRGGLAQTIRRDDLRPSLERVLDVVRPDLVHLFHLRRLTLSLADVVSERGLPLVASLTDYWFTCFTGQLQFPADTPCAGPDGRSLNCLRHAAAKAVPPLGRLPAPLWRLVAGGLALGGRGGLAASYRDLRERPAVMRAALARMDRVLMPSRLMAETFAAQGFAMENVRLCPYGIDCGGLAALPPRQPWLGPRERPLRVRFIGTLSHAKGAHVLLRALDQLGPGLPLDVQIHGSLKEHPRTARLLMEMARRHPEVTFAGVFAPDELFAVLAATDLLVIPSLWRENSPLILLQALASGLPIVASDVQGMTEHLKPGVNGQLFAPGAATELAAWLRRFLREPEALAALCGHGGTPRTIRDYVYQLEEEYRLAS